MQVVYYSKAHNTERFISKLDKSFDFVSIKDYNSNEPFILITPTYKFGKVPDPVLDFLKEYGNNIKGVISSGNMNWGDFYALAGKQISKDYNVPWLYKYEMSGNTKDVIKVNEILKGWMISD